MQAQDSDASPVWRFGSREFQLAGAMRVQREKRERPTETFGSVVGNKFFGLAAVARGGTAPESVEYRVEPGHDDGDFSICFRMDGRLMRYFSDYCEEVLVAVNIASGQLFLKWDEPEKANARKYRTNFGLFDFGRRRVNLSATVGADGHRVYQDVLVDPPPAPAECVDYPEPDAHRYRCLYGKQKLPAVRPATLASHTGGLPDGLLQDAGNYRLVFAEEFDGTPEDTGDGCANGMVLLSTDVFSYDPDACANVDSAGDPCENVDGGRYFMSTANGCGNGLTTAGKFTFRYGYFEYRYSFNLRRAHSYANAATVIGDPKSPQQMIAPKYGISIDSYRDLLEHTAIEIDVTEYTPTSRTEVGHRNLNNPDWLENISQYPPRNSTRRVTYCFENNLTVATLHFSSLDTGCSTSSNNNRGDKVTVTKGIEWTPAGYRYFLKVDGASGYVACTIEVGETIHTTTYGAQTHCPTSRRATVAVSPGEFFVLDANGIVLVKTQEYTDSGGTTRTRNVELDAGERAARLPNHTDGLILEQHAVSHFPLQIGFSFWSFTAPQRIANQFEVDYIRVYQPDDGYSSLEPVYQ